MVNKNPKVSVIVPVYNGEETLAQCLQPLINQDFLDYEIIVVDNNSNDGTKKIIDDFAKKSDKVKYFFEPKPGRGNARNAGIDACRGEVIAMTDADCVVPLDWLTRICDPILNKGDLAVVGFEKDGIKNYWTEMRQESDLAGAKARTEDGYIDCLDTKNFAIKSNLLRKHRFDPQLVALEDWKLFIELKKEAVKVRFISDLFIEHYNDSSCLELFETNFERGKNAARIISSYKDDQQFKNLFKDDEVFNSIKLWNFIVFIPWAIWQLITNTRRAPYKIVNDFAWKCGVITFFMRRS